MSVDEFLGLSWFELNLHIERFRYKQKQIKDKEEAEWLRIRKIWVLIINYIRDPKIKPGAFKETDLIKLSFDEDEKEVKPMTPEEVEKLFPKTLNTKIDGNI